MGSYSVLHRRSEVERSAVRGLGPKVPRRAIQKSWPFLLMTMLCSAAALLFAIGQPWFVIRDHGVWTLACCLVGIALAFATAPPFIVRVFVGALFLRLAAALFVFAYLNSSYGFDGFEGNDDLHWDRQARQVASGQSEWVDVLKGEFSAGYVLITAATYRMAGAGPLAPRILNVVLGALVVLAVYAMARELRLDEGMARLAAYWIALCPVLVYWSIAFQKDILLALVFCLGLLMCVRLFKRGVTIPIIVGLIVSLTALALIRPLSAHILGITIGLSALYRLKVRGATRGMVALGTMAVVVGFAIASIGKGLDRADIADFQTQYVDRAAAFERAATQAEGGVSSLIAAAPRSVRMLIGPVITLLSPVPPGIAWGSNFSYSFMSLFQPLQVLLLPYFLARLWRVVRDRELRLTGAILLVPAIIAALVANSVYAVGQITKYRVMVEPLILLFSAWEFRQADRRLRFAYVLVSGALAVGAVAIYVLLKAMT